MYRHASERSQIPNINTALANTSYVPTPTATPNSSVNLSRFPSTSSTLTSTSTTTTATATSWNSGISSSDSSNPGAARVVTLLNALGPSLGPASPRAQAQFQKPIPSPSSPPARIHQTQEIEVSPAMAGSIASPKKTHFLDRFSGSPSIGSGTSSTASSTMQSKTAVRMVGRGGSGSKPRSVKSVPSIPDVTRVKSGTSSAASSKNGKVRYVGRGGQGSKHKVAKEEGDEENDEPGVGLKLPWKKVKKSKSKMTLNSGKESFTNSEEYDYYLRPTSNASRDTLTSSNPPSGTRGPAEISVTSLGSIGLDPYGISPAARRNLLNSKSADASLNKVAKQMGELPPHLIYQQLLNDRHGLPNSEALPPRLDTQIPGHRHGPSATTPSISVSEEPTPTSTQHRVMNILSSLGSPSAYSLTPSFETSASCELHRFGLADDMSETWGEVRDNGDKHHCYSDNAGLEDDYEAPSPITFSPPTPIDRKKGVARCTVCHIETGMELEQDAISESSVSIWDGEAGIGSMASGNGDETTDAMVSLAADKSNSTTSSSPSCHVHAVTGSAVRPVRSNQAALDSPETGAGTHSHLQLGSSPPRSAQSRNGSGRAGEEEDDLRTPVVEQGNGAAYFGSLIDERMNVASASSSVYSLSSAEALSGHAATTSSCLTTPPESASFAPSKDNLSIDFESKYLPPLPSPAPSTTSFASSISSASSLPYASTLASSRPETPFGNLTRLRVPSPSMRSGAAGSMTSIASNSTTNSTGSKPVVGAKRHLAFEEDVVVLVGAQSRGRRRSVNWGAGSIGLGAPASAAREEIVTAPVSVGVEVPGRAWEEEREEAE
ncbi:hypothetical protein FA13DRAFT_1711209 [Coprinellus micaceus]|uniref:Uncharacterized protein n=1 Tax=Coprinellus micaceus TaxID=71717 RepID=A0A4Y7T6L8_COPMI|nr:hypothetical protein FA13DRAFT_1711209 [Coprinellus micaceus]